MMKFGRLVVAAACCSVFLLPMASADNIKVDYSHEVDFSQFHTYTWGRIQSSDSLAAQRIQREVNLVLQEDGWQEVPQGGQVTIMARDQVHNEQEEETFYEGMRFGMSTTSNYTYQVGHLVIALFNTQSRSLLWRGVSRGELSDNPSANRKRLFQDIHAMFRDFPPKPRK
ncbi:MAG: DUF4136 domain-containing protein [Acidobacteriaceae bacterium]